MKLDVIKRYTIGSNLCFSSLLLLLSMLTLTIFSMVTSASSDANVVYASSPSDNNTGAKSSFANATTYELVKEWGGEGEEDGQFARPHDLDFSPSEDKLYIVDRDNDRIQVFDKNGTFLFKWGEEGDGEGKFNLAYGLDVDKLGNVWVAERGNDRVQKFDPEGNFVMMFGSEGSEEGQFSHPRHVAVDSALEYVYVADSRNHRIQKFDINGNFVKSFGTEGNQSGQFNLPTTVVIDSHGDLYVNERGNERVQKLDTEGNPILAWGSKGSGPNEFCHIEHLGIDKFDNIFVTDPQSDPGCSQKGMIKKYTSSGNFITQWQVVGEDVDPEHLAIDSQGNVYVSNRADDKILVYKPTD